MKASVTKPPALGSKFFKPLPQWPVVGNSLAFVSEHSSIAFRDLTCAAFADYYAFADCPHRSTALCRRQKFPSAMIFRASIWSN
jgi:hypothetical protein